LVHPSGAVASAALDHTLYIIFQEDRSRHSIKLSLLLIASSRFEPFSGSFTGTKFIMHQDMETGSLSQLTSKSTGLGSLSCVIAIDIPR
jgi:hypothetical protein